MMALPTTDVLLRDEQLYQRCKRRGAGSLRILREWSQVDPRAKGDLVVVLRQEALFDRDEARLARSTRTRGQKRFLLLPDRSPRESFPEAILRLNVRSADRIHTPKFDRSSESTFMDRYFSGLECPADSERIADAWWEGEELVVLSPRFKRIRVPLSAITRLNNAPVNDRDSFEIDSLGEFIYWPSIDVHLGWPQLMQAVDPATRVRAKQRSARFNRHYGDAIRRVREEAGITQRGISGLDSRTIRRIEKGESAVTSSALIKLAEAHRLSVDEYMNRLASRVAENCA